MCFRPLLVAALIPSVGLAEEPASSLVPEQLDDLALLGRYSTVLRDKPGLGGPIGLTLGGLASTGAGVAGLVFAQRFLNAESGIDETRGLSTAALVLGAATLTAGIAWWIQRGLARLEADRELTALDDELQRRGLSVTAGDADASSSGGVSPHVALGLLSLLPLFALLALVALGGGGGPR